MINHDKECNCARCIEARKAQEQKERYDRKLEQAGVRVYVWEKGGKNVSPTN